MTARPTLVVCEDGNEYIERFRRFLASAYDLRPAAGFAEALAACRTGASGLLLDLDFRRTPAHALVDEAGLARGDLGAENRHRLAAVQGILILRALRAAGVTQPAWLFADLDDPARAAFLESTLAPTTIVPSTAGMGEIARLLRSALVT